MEPSDIAVGVDGPLPLCLSGMLVSWLGIIMRSRLSVVDDGWEVDCRTSALMMCG